MNSDKSTTENDCVCMTPPFNYKNYESTNIGDDLTNGRYGEVSIKKCMKCGKLWLDYHVEYEGYSGSGRWFRGLISENEASNIAPCSAVNFLEKLDWYFYGGSYFSSTGKMGSGKVMVDR